MAVYVMFMAVAILMSCQLANGVRMCGSQLTDTLAVLCSGRGFHWGTDKRSGQMTISKRPSNADDSEASLMKRQSEPRGIVDECCRNACSMRTLESYCRSSVDNMDETPFQQGLHHSVIASSGRPVGDQEGSESARIPNTIAGFNPQSASRLRVLESFISRDRPLTQTSSTGSRHLNRNRQYQFFFVSPLSHRSSIPVHQTREHKLRSLYHNLRYQ